METLFHILVGSIAPALSGLVVVIWRLERRVYRIELHLFEE